VKRLPEEFNPSDADEAYVAALLEDVHPFEPSAEQMQRVWTTLERSAPRRRRGRVSGPVIAALVLCGATAASATMPHVWSRMQRAYADLRPAPVAAVANTLPGRAPPAAPPVPAFLADRASDTVALPATAAPQPGTAVRKSMATRTPAAAAHPADSPTSAMLMIEAIRERRAGNLTRARELASEYRTKNPTGALYEEALSLSFQAAAVLGDDEAKPLARLYVKRYPAGPFRAQAQRVLEAAH
jgi:hypothetical protein